MVEEIKKQKEMKLRDQTLAAAGPDPDRVSLVRSLCLAEGAKLGSDLVWCREWTQS